MADNAIQIDISGVDAFSARMLTAPKTVQEETRKGINRITTQGAKFAQGNLTANGSVVTGNLRRSIFPNPAVVAGGQVMGEYGPHGVDYAEKVEKGRKGFRGSGKPLRFRPKGSDTVIYRWSVGPAKGKPYMKPSLTKLRPLAHKEFEAVGQRIIARLGGGK